MRIIKRVYLLGIVKTKRRLGFVQTFDYMLFPHSIAIDATKETVFIRTPLKITDFFIFAPLKIEMTSNPISGDVGSRRALALLRGRYNIVPA